MVTMILLTTLVFGSNATTSTCYVDTITCELDFVRIMLRPRLCLVAQHGVMVCDEKATEQYDE